jgi:hypothetical protein
LIHFVIDENADGPRRYVSTAVSSPLVEQLIDLTTRRLAAVLAD